MKGISRAIRIMAGGTLFAATIYMILTLPGLLAERNDSIPLVSQLEPHP